jgi:hypothetical protein
MVSTWAPFSTRQILSIVSRDRVFLKSDAICSNSPDPAATAKSCSARPGPVNTGVSEVRTPLTRLLTRVCVLIFA